MGTNFVVVDGVCFEYGAVRALEQVGFGLEQGAVTALVGPNGAGKTTLLRCLAGLERPYAGTIAVDGVDVVGQPRLARGLVGFQQDFFGVYDALSVGRNLVHAAAIQGVAAELLDQRVLWAAQAVGLDQRMADRAGSLSRGLRQRLAIARAIVHHPRLLLMDEPASGLDPEARHRLSALIRDLRGMGMTLVVSSHILAELEDYSTHMLTLRAGRASGPVAVGRPQAARWRIEVAGDGAAALAVLAACSCVADPVATAPDMVEFDCAADRAGRARLVADLVAAGIGVCALAPAGGRLEDLYLGTEAGR